MSTVEEVYAAHQRANFNFLRDVIEDHSLTVRMDARLVTISNTPEGEKESLAIEWFVDPVFSEGRPPLSTAISKVQKHLIAALSEYVDAEFTGECKTLTSGGRMVDFEIEEPEEEQSCTCGGNCKDTPRILCFECEKMKWREVSTSGESWLLNFGDVAECDELGVHGRLYTKCDDFVPKGGKK